MQRGNAIALVLQGELSKRKVRFATLLRMSNTYGLRGLKKIIKEILITTS